jgi:hypothetical protein
MTGSILRKQDAKQRARHENARRPDVRRSEPNSGDAPAKRPIPSSDKIISLHKLAVAYYTQKRYEESERL